MRKWQVSWDGTRHTKTIWLKQSSTKPPCLLLLLSLASRGWKTHEVSQLHHWTLNKYRHSRAGGNPNCVFKFKIDSHFHGNDRNISSICVGLLHYSLLPSWQLRMQSSLLRCRLTFRLSEATVTNSADKIRWRRGLFELPRQTMGCVVC